MEKEVKEVTVEELKRLIQSQEGEFIIRVEPNVIKISRYNHHPISNF